MEVQQYPVVLKGGPVIMTACINPGKTRHAVFLHGLGASPRAMYPFLEYVAVKEGVTIIAPRLPCHGKSDDVDTADEFIARLGEWGEAVGLSGDLVVGHSLGALVLPHIAKRFPNQIGAGICLALPTEPLSGRLDLYRRLVHVGTDVTITTSVALIEAFRYGDGPRFSRAVQSTASEGFRLRQMMKVLQGLSDVELVLDGLDIPIALMWGERDSATPPQTERLDHPIVLPGQHHCFLMLREDWEPIRAEFHAKLEYLSPSQSATAS